MRRGLVLSILFLLMACQRTPAALPVVDARAPVAATETPVAGAAAGAAAVTMPPRSMPPMLTPVPTKEATSTPTEAPLEPSTLAAPAWLRHLPAALDGVETTGRSWQVLLTDDPLAALRNGSALLALVPDSLPLPVGFTRHTVGSRTLVVTVPFTEARESTTMTAVGELTPETGGRAALIDWAQLTPERKSLAVDGRRPGAPDYPLRQPWSLVGPPSQSPAAVELALRAGPPLEAEPLVHLAAVGDLMLDRGLGYVVGVQGNIDYPFVHVADLLREADLAVGNVESALGDVGEPQPKSYAFQAPPAAAEALATAGFDIVSLANNHALDYGPASLLQGIDLLQSQGVTPIGAGADIAAARAPHVVALNGLTLAFLAYVNVPVEVGGFDTEAWTATESAPGLAWGDPAAIAADVTAARALADHVIIVLHSGYEYVDSPSPPQMEAATAALDAGATLVIGHHAHLLQGVQFRQRQVIVYGLGNFAFEIDGDPSTAILDVWLDANGVREIAFTPAIIQFGGQPRLATPAEASVIRQTIYRLTVPLNPVR